MWLNQLLEETKEVETPRQWLYWSGLAAISAVVSPNVYYYKRYYSIKPNLYVMLIGRSGLGKGYGISLAKKMVKLVDNTRVIAGTGTIEGIVKTLATVKARRDGSIPYKDARGFIAASEFAAALYESSKALAVLTDLYDGHYNPDWDITLKNVPLESLKLPCVTILGGANPDMFNLAVDKVYMSGGFVARTHLINAEKRALSNALVDYDDEDEQIGDSIAEKLACYLKKISKLEGRMRFTDEGRALYKEWFAPYRILEVDDKTGTYDRLNDHLIKVAMCISLSRKSDMLMEREDVEEAIVACSNLTSNAKSIAGMQGGGSSTAEHAKAFLKIMLGAPNYELNRKKVLQKGFGDFNSDELDKVIETMTQTGYAVQKSGGAEGIKYQLTKNCIDYFTKNQKGES